MDNNIELYIERTRSCIMVEGMIGNIYVDFSYKIVNNNSVVRSYGNIGDVKLESLGNVWVIKGRRKRMTKDEVLTIEEVERFLSNGNYKIEKDD